MIIFVMIFACLAFCLSLWSWLCQHPTSNHYLNCILVINQFLTTYYIMMYRDWNYSYFLFEVLENIVLTILCNYDYDIIFLLSDSYYSIFIFGYHYSYHYYFWSENNPKAHKILMNVSYCIANKFLGGILYVFIKYSFIRPWLFLISCR